MKKEIGLLIQKIRLEKNISRIELAERVGCTRKAVEYWEKGQRTMSIENADKIFKALDVSITIGKE